MIEIKSARGYNKKLAQGLARLYSASGFSSFDGEISQDRLREIYKLNNVYRLVVFDDSKRGPFAFVGMGRIWFQPQDSGNYISEIHDIFVLDEYQGRGLGGKLVDYLIDIAKRFAKTKEASIILSLTSNPNNPKRKRAIDIYLKRGFRLVAKTNGKKGTNLYKMWIDKDGQIVP